ncbi:MAG: FAD-dependent oxidoreductase [Clostridia bacterium]|nr:FAD-dependent oxidoreductase [Clostridia bacterium]
MRHIEERISVPVKNKCDVLVAGGGIAGISAALASARQGKDTLLIENEFALGGLATLGIVTIYLPICDGEGHQIIYGIGEELLRLSIKYGIEESDAAVIPVAWLENGSDEDRKKQRFQVQYNPNMYILELEKLLLDAGVRILYGTKICAVNMLGDRISDVIIENKSGRSAIEVGTVVDCTGDADVAKLSGAKTATFSQGNILAAWYYYMRDGEKRLNMLGFCDIPDDEKTEENKVTLLHENRFSGLDAEELSLQMQLSHTQTLSDYKRRREKNKDTEITMLATIPQIRMTRRIVGDIELDTSDDKKYFEDSIGMTGNWKKRGPVYEIPFSALRSVNVKNLLAAGRCISVTDNMWDVTRVIPTCAVTGEAAGVAAAMFEDFSNIDITALQSELQKNGVKLHTNEVL